MKNPLPAVLAALISSIAVSVAVAQDAPAAPAAAPTAGAPSAEATSAEAPQAEEALSGAAADFKVLFEKIGAKLQAGQHTEEALSAEIGEFDAIVAKHADAKHDDLAMIVFMKARLYLEVLNNYPKAVAVLKKLQADYPATDVGKNVGEIIEVLEKQIAADAALALGNAFPDFAEKDTAGQPLSIGGLKGKVVLVDFWATWCGPCVAELPNVTAAYEKYRAKGFEIVGISLDEDRAKLDDFVKTNKMGWPQFFDGLGWKNKLAQQYGISSIPATFLLDREGRIVAKDLRGDQLEKELAKLLND